MFLFCFGSGAVIAGVTGDVNALLGGFGLGVVLTVAEAALKALGMKW